MAAKRAGKGIDLDRIAERGAGAVAFDEGDALAGDTSTYNLRFDASLRRQLSAHLSLTLLYDYVRDENPVFDLESIATLKLMLGYQF